MTRFVFGAALLGFPWGAMGAPTCFPTLDREFTLSNLVPHVVERHQGLIASGNAGLSFIQPDFPPGSCSESDDPAARPKLAWSDSANRFGLLFLGGQEFRHDGDGVWASEAGGIASGRLGPATFRMDARTYVEAGDQNGRPSFDREIIDDQSGEVTGSLDYRSYSRFRGGLSLELPLGNLTVARDAAHWGPGLFGNLMLNQAAVPFYQYLYTAELGPLRVASLYGDLLIGDNQSYSGENLEQRSLYAHRFELLLGSAWQVGFAEQLILYDMAKPYLFAPVFPLFIAKGFLFENNTNGSMAADLAWRSPFSTLFYGQFLLDDLESPSSLLTKNYVQNKWAALAGAHWSRQFDVWRLGTVAEYIHVEPWVYAHFTPGTAQAANVGRPLGNPYGADSRTIIAKAYLRRGAAWYGGLKSVLAWKGRGAGADIEQPAPDTPLAPKEFLENESFPGFSLEPEFAWTGRWLAVSASARLGDDPSLRMGLRVFQ